MGLVPIFSIVIAIPAYSIEKNCNRPCNLNSGSSTDDRCK